MEQSQPSPSPAAIDTNRGDRPDSPAAADLVGLVVAHHAPLYRYAYRLSGCAAEAEDLTQQTFLIAQRKLHQVRDPGRAAAWLFAVLRSCFLKSLRRQRPASAASANVALEEFSGPTPETDEIDREQLANALTELPAEFRVVLLMFYFEELSYQEIAEQLEVPIGTVMSRLSRAKGHLRKRLESDPLSDDAPRGGAARSVAGRPSSKRERATT
jgi:RNA polymerase sigma-70 factor (ECF subfamily)